jgi:hypothetical protein
MDGRERRARIGVRHCLAASERASAVEEVARCLVCLHATDPATVYLSAWARLREPSVEAWIELCMRNACCCG